MRRAFPQPLPLLVPAVFLVCLAPASRAQIVFSIDGRSPTVSLPECGMVVPITEGDLLGTCNATGIPVLGPLPTPAIVITAGAGGLGLAGHAGCVGHPAGTLCPIEVDAVSYGTDLPFSNLAVVAPGRLWFSTDQHAIGIPGSPAAPNVLSEGPVADLAADAMVNLGPLPPGPLPPGPPIGHVGAVDGNGLYSASGFRYPGTGLLEPPFSGAFLQDNIDALNVGDLIGFPPGGIYFSLEGSLPDTKSNNVGSGTAGAHGFRPGDVLHKSPVALVPALYAPAPVLGLDLFGLVGDDLDALILAENGVPGYQPSAVPYDWLGPGGSDMLLFSVRRGSFVIGLPDSIFGLAIQEGDVLTTPLPTAAGGVSPFPGIFIAAENLGLATTRVASGTLGCPADVTALDSQGAPLFDCNGNGIEDSVDIANGASGDLNMNGIPDECEGNIVSYCDCVVGAPCNNNFFAGGCRNSTGVGATLTPSGSLSVSIDDLVLTLCGMQSNQFGILFSGPTAAGPIPFGDGQRCVGGPLNRFPVRMSSNAGCFSEGPGIAAFSAANFPLAGHILANSTWYFQGWYRDPGGPCGSAFNLSNALRLIFNP